MCGAGSQLTSSATPDQPAFMTKAQALPLQPQASPMVVAAPDVAPMAMGMSACRPVQAIKSRLMAASTLPGWAAFLPEELQANLQGQFNEQNTMGEMISPPMQVSSAMWHTGDWTLDYEGGVPTPQSNQKVSWTSNGARASWPAGGTGWTECHYPQHAGSEDNELQVDQAEESTSPSLQSLRGRVWALSKDAKGCWLVQQALEDAAGDEERTTLALELKGHVWKAMQCPHANFVLQRCITTMKPNALQFIIDEIQSATQAAKHRYGCRVMERLIEHCLPEQVEPLVDDLLVDAAALCTHVFGHYVMQHLLEHGTCDQASGVIKILQENAATLGGDTYGCSVVAKALGHGFEEDRKAMASALIQSEGVIPAMSFARHGHMAVKLVLAMVEGSERDSACRQLYACEKKLRDSRYGRVVLTFVKRQYQDPTEGRAQ